MIKCEVNKNKVPAITLEMEGTEKDLANEVVNAIMGMYNALHKENQQDAILFREDVSKALRLDGPAWVLLGGDAH